MLIGKENWRYQELYLNLRLRKGDEKDKIFIFETIPRIFYSFPIVGIKFYAGLGLGFGVQPYHTYSDNKDVGKIFALSGQWFTGFKAPDIYKNFGCFMELNITGMFFPFYSSKTDDVASQKTTSSTLPEEVTYTEYTKDDPDVFYARLKSGNSIFYDICIFFIKIFSVFILI